MLTRSRFLAGFTYVLTIDGPKQKKKGREDWMNSSLDLLRVKIDSDETTFKSAYLGPGHKPRNFSPDPYGSRFCLFNREQLHLHFNPRPSPAFCAIDQLETGRGAGREKSAIVSKGRRRVQSILLNPYRGLCGSP